MFRNFSQFEINYNLLTLIVLQNNFLNNKLSHKNIKSGNFQITTVNQNIYIFGIARNEEERKLVINEANQINDVEEVVSSIFLVSDLTNNQRLKN
mgnify:CR=1 FL=1